MRRRSNPGRTFRLRAVNTSPVGWLALERPRSNAEFLIPNRSARSSEPRSRPGWQLPPLMRSMGRAPALPSFGWAPMHCSQCLRAGAKATEAWSPYVFALVIENDSHGAAPEARLDACDPRRTPRGRSHPPDVRKLSDTWTLISNFAGGTTDCV